MISELTVPQIENVLSSQVVGRIGCYADSRIYVIPVTYAYDGKHVYAHSKEGLKIKMMRKNPEVCFQVDIMENMANWRSVIIWGKYEELRDEESYRKGMKILVNRTAPFITSQTAEAKLDLSMGPHKIEKGMKAIAFRIKVTEKTGRFEKSDLK